MVAACFAVFEVTQEHRARRRVWPGQSIDVGEGIPAQRGASTLETLADSRCFCTGIMIGSTLFLAHHFS